jgi:hypothetical protein
VRLLSIIFSLAISFATYGQVAYSPTILILDPAKKKFDSTVLSQIGKFYMPLHISSEEDSLKPKRENVIKMDMAENEFGKKMDYGSYFTLFLNTMVSYVVFGETNKCIVFPSHDTASGNIEDLKLLAKKYDVQWIVNPLFCRAYSIKGAMYTTVRLQVYKSKGNKIVLDKEYTGGTKNPGFELSCEDGTLECTINNIVNSAVNDIVLIILGHYQH